MIGRSPGVAPGPSTDHLDGLLAGIAGAQGGAVGRWQLVANGVGEDAIDLRLATGHLHRLVLAGRWLTGVYAVGRPLLHPGLGWQWAAWLACGPESVISDRTAADVGDLLTSRRLEVTIPPEARRRRAGPPQQILQRIRAALAARSVDHPG